ncbi:MAG: hypothetical protein NZM33_13585 [Bryobacteraceae bacterium]|nr:hypothetical protein [Bryobacteraceae bacterium]
MLVAVPPALAQSASVALSVRLAEWKAETERVGAVRIVLARVYTDFERNELFLPSDTEAFPILEQFFEQESFREQFVRTHAMTVTYTGLAGRYSFILLNMALESQWEGAEEAVIAHELGHAWLAALNFPAPPYELGERSCLAVHTGDVVQHVLIRKEMDRRHIPWRGYWIRNLEAALERLKSQPPASRLEPGRTAALGALWADTRLGLTEADWAGLPQFLQALEEKFPAAKAPAEAIVARLGRTNLSERDAYAAALRDVGAILRRDCGFTEP